jgi:hypothetical protein
MIYALPAANFEAVTDFGITGLAGTTRWTTSASPWSPASRW